MDPLKEIIKACLPEGLKVRKVLDDEQIYEVSRGRDVLSHVYVTPKWNVYVGRNLSRELPFIGNLETDGKVVIKLRRALRNARKELEKNPSEREMLRKVKIPSDRTKLLLGRMAGAIRKIMKSEGGSG
jgi:ribosomal protein L30/L7E